ncbi:nucleoside/nucleotide kinase family protein [Arthrobacter echini]|uniref:Nucleoside/nucleotide kinase family protein n=1 Tax=Arthrobacter echini TaxID=1529066 RepID=A0A4S5E356_9MICC|nr:nucleoside/nucleotide kinase family protein [Arthrobacter echini]THJ65855.1 nucleoside/nucleotide kinase family protein [Arthrobacter echini]
MMETVAIRSVQDLRDLVPRPGRDRRVMIGLVGAPGAGKSAIAAEIAALEPALHALVPLDGFHLADQALIGLGLLDRKGAPETFDAYGYAALLSRLRTGPAETVYAPTFERDLEQPLANALPIASSSSLLITEGNYLLLDAPGWQEARSQLDEVWFLDVDPEIRRSRLIERHVRFGKSLRAATAWVQRVDDPNAALVAASRERADLVLDVTGWTIA